MDNTYPMGNTEYPPRQTLSPEAAAILSSAQDRSGASYRRVAKALGISHPHWWRLCQGKRAPSTAVAIKIIRLFDLEPEAADLLIDESVTKPDSR